MFIPLFISACNEEIEMNTEYPQIDSIEIKLKEKIYEGISKDNVEKVLKKFNVEYSYISKEMMPDTRTRNNVVNHVPEYVCGKYAGGLSFKNIESPMLSIKIYITCDDKVEYMKIKKIYKNVF